MLENMKISDPERRLLSALQRDASASLGDLAQAAGMAQSTVWRKVQEFEKAGVIRARVALLDPAKLGVKLCVLASVRLHDHDEAAITGFTALIARLPEVLECHSVSGNTDYILKIRVADVEAYEAFMTQNLLRSPYVRELVSSFVLKEIKATTAIPI